MASRMSEPRALFLAIVCLLLSGPATGQEAGGPKRVALVIGNSTYKNVAPLVNPSNDAADIASKLKKLKFDVLLATDATQTRMMALLEEFKSRITREHVAVYRH